MDNSPPEEVILPKLERALRRAGDTHDFRRDVVPMLAQRRAQWWGNEQAAIITELLSFPNYDVLNYWLVAGELDACLALQPEIDRWARMQGCRRAIATGRSGWLQVLPRYGWKPYAIAFAKDLRQ
jgi:hypothetical protein